jgi:hypothetical protein
MTPQEKKELDFVIETLFKVAIGIVILSVVLFTTLHFLN